jgi:hypothetical protein
MEQKLRDDAPKRVTTQRAAAIETATVKGFHPKLWHGEGNHNDTLKRVTTPTGIAAVGAKALSFRPEKPSHRSQTRAGRPKLGLRHAIWELPKPKHRNTRIVRTSPPA